MDQLILTQDMMRKYRKTGFDRHHILEAWDRCRGSESSLMDTLLKIRSRDQLRSEQRLVWDGKRAQIKRISNRTQLRKLLSTDFLKGYIWNSQEEFKELRKKGLLSPKEYRSSRGLNLVWQDNFGVSNEFIQALTDRIRGYLRRLRHFSIEFDVGMVSDVNVAPLLKSIRHNFVGLVSFKISLRKVLRLTGEDLHGFERLFAWLMPTLKHLNLDFAENRRSEINFPEVLGWIIMKNLHKLETLCLSFRDTQFPITLVRFFINTACPRMKNLRTLSFQMENCYLVGEWDLPLQASSPSNLQCLKLDFDRCASLSTEYLSKLQKEVITVCPVLEELYVRLPNYKRFSGRYFSFFKEEFLQKLNLKRLAVELSHELEDIWGSYQDILAIERAEEMRIEGFVGEQEEFFLDWESWIEEENEESWRSFDEYGWVVCEEMEVARMWDEIEEQDEVERIYEEEWKRENVLDEIWDWYEEETKSVE